MNRFAAGVGCQVEDLEPEEEHGVACPVVLVRFWQQWRLRESDGSVLVGMLMSEPDQDAEPAESVVWESPLMTR